MTYRLVIEITLWSWTENCWIQ